MQDTLLIIIAAVLAVIIGFLIYYFRDYIPVFQKTVSKTEVDSEIEMLLDNIRRLSRSHEYNKASLLVWKTFQTAAEGLLGMNRIPSQTARAYGLTMMSFDGVSQETVEPIFELFEKARYSNSEITLQEFNSGLTGLHRFLAVANQISSQMAGGSSEAGEMPREEVDFDVEDEE